MLCSSIMSLGTTRTSAHSCQYGYALLPKHLCYIKLHVSQQTRPHTKGAPIVFTCHLSCIWFYYRKNGVFGVNLYRLPEVEKSQSVFSHLLLNENVLVQRLIGIVGIRQFLNTRTKKFLRSGDSCYKGNQNFK